LYFVGQDRQFGDLHGRMLGQLLGVIGPGPTLQHQALAPHDYPEIVHLPSQTPLDVRLDLLGGSRRHAWHVL
jgi:hypothetical protein